MHGAQDATSRNSWANTARGTAAREAHALIMRAETLLALPRHAQDACVAARL